MTSPLKSPQSFHARPLTQTLTLPPRRHLVYRCARSGRLFIQFSQHCNCCHPAALMHGHEVDLAIYTRLRAAA
jgi:hypothetical protein